jgi:hypothetical protein
MFKGTFSIATSLLKLHTYKAMGVPQDCKGRNKYCRWFQQTVFNGLLDSELMFYSDEV